MRFGGIFPFSFGVVANRVMRISVANEVMRISVANEGCEWSDANLFVANGFDWFVRILPSLNKKKAKWNHCDPGLERRKGKNSNHCDWASSGPCDWASSGPSDWASSHCDLASRVATSQLFCEQGCDWSLRASVATKGCCDWSLRPRVVFLKYESFLDIMWKSCMNLTIFGNFPKYNERCRRVYASCCRTKEGGETLINDFETIKGTSFPLK